MQIKDRMNLLIEGNNIKGLNYLLRKKNLKEKIDLVYIDPPFATGSNFTITEDRAATISNSRSGSIAYSDRLTGFEFIEFLRQRLLLLRELLSASGSIYLHIDYKIGHYVKVMMDEVFGMENFRNDITRVKCNPKNFKRTGYGNVKDLILFYSKTAHPIWNEPREKYSAKDLEKLFPKMDKRGRHYTTVPIHAPGETQRGKSNQPFRGMMPPKGRHWRTDIVLDCFCGSGTTLKSAQRLNRNWIGIDQSEHAIKATVEKLEDIEGDFFTGKLEYEFMKL